MIRRHHFLRGLAAALALGAAMPAALARIQQTHPLESFRSGRRCH